MRRHIRSIPVGSEGSSRSVDNVEKSSHKSAESLMRLRDQAQRCRDHLIIILIWRSDALTL